MSTPHQSVSPVAAENSRKNLSLGLVAVAVASSIIASTCCVVPLVLVLLGITGAWMVNLTSLQHVTPVFVVVALGTIGWAGYLVFQPVPQCSSPEEGAACKRNRGIMRRVYLASVVFIAALLLFPLIAPYFY